jgi:cobalt-zinc-cadmium efflux system membrane fusion protein
MKNKKTWLICLISIGFLAVTGITYYLLDGNFLATSMAVENAELDEHGHKEGTHEENGEKDNHGSGEDKCVVLTEDQMKNFGVQVAMAEPGPLQVHLTLPGEVAVNADRVAHIIPRMPGVVREVRKNLGDQVKKGEVMAVLDSRELADAKASFLAARERVDLAQTNFNREEQLWKKKISAEQEYLQAKQVLAEAKIELRTTEQKLHALGFSEKYLSNLPAHEEINFTRYELWAPFDGTVIEKHISLGEMLKDDTEAFLIADLSSVWVNLNVHQSDLPLIRTGQPVTVSAGPGIPDMQGTLSYLAPIIGEQTRTTPARVVLSNTEGLWRPGLFVTGRITVENVSVPLRVTKEAVLILDGKPSVFVKVGDEFEPQPVTTGRVNDKYIEIVSGLTQGQIYVAKGAYILKLEANKFKGDPCGH